MSRSLREPGVAPDGSFTHAASQTRFEIHTTNEGLYQSFARVNESGTYRVAYAIGSGAHAVGYLIEIDNHLFQSPLSYYTRTKRWDVAPGYEQSEAPDFSRPATPECLACHADRARPIANTLNSYENPPLTAMAISCDRCHGPVEEHLRKPAPGSIVNPAKLSGAARDSICEQCHLTGEIRIPNPGRHLSDFRPGEPVEDVFTVYVGTGGPREGLKVISHSEQLALSLCARMSGGRLWCGTCHDPHAERRPSHADYRGRCLTCHAATLPAKHAGRSQDCIGCHMPQLPARDGGHTVFTDHRIARDPKIPVNRELGAPDLRAWRQPALQFRERNFALALTTHGLENGLPDEAIRGFRMLSRMEPKLANDTAALTALGSILLTAKESREAQKRFARALALNPDYAPYEVNLGEALLAEGDTAGATEHLERAVKLDPLLRQAVQALAGAYQSEGDTNGAAAVRRRYTSAMGSTTKSR